MLLFIVCFHVSAVKSVSCHTQPPTVPVKQPVAVCVCVDRRKRLGGAESRSAGDSLLLAPTTSQLLVTWKQSLHSIAWNNMLHSEYLNHNHGNLFLHCTTCNFLEKDYLGVAVRSGCQPKASVFDHLGMRLSDQPSLSREIEKCMWLLLSGFYKRSGVHQTAGTLEHF